MPQYKNIRIKMKNGKTRTQRVQVLSSGKYKFVKNTNSKKVSKSRRKKPMAKKKSYSSRARGIIGKYGTVGILEDALIGYAGSQVVMQMGYPLDTAMPITRIIQGVAGKTLKRRGAGRLEHGVIDLLDVYLIKKGIGIPNLLAWR